MGMYTEIVVNARVREDAPASVIEILRCWFDHTKGSPTEPTSPLPDHPLFKTDRWSMIGRCSSYYFQPESTSRMYFSDISNTWYISSRSDLKNYDGEIEAFFDWVAPYLDQQGEMIGYSRYEEHDAPTIYFVSKEGKALALRTVKPEISGGVYDA